MADLIATRPNFRGFLVPLEGVTVDETATTMTQAGPRPGGAVPESDTSLALIMSGEQTDGDVDLQVVVSGVPTGRDDGVGLVHKPSSAGAYRGWDAPCVIHAWEAAVPVSVTTQNKPRYPAVATLADGTVLMVYGGENATLTEDRIIAITRNPTTGHWSGNSYVYSYGRLLGGDNEAHPAILVLPSGRILCYYWVPDVVQNLWLVYMSYSDNNGTTWTLGSKRCNPIAMEKNAAGPGATGVDKVGRISAVHHRTGIGLILTARLADTTIGLPSLRDRALQAASTGGSVFRVVYDAFSASAGAGSGSPDSMMVQTMMVVGDAIGVMYGAINFYSGRPWYLRLGSVWQSMADVTPVEASLGGTRNCGELLTTTIAWDDDRYDLTACVDETGIIYAVGRMMPTTEDPTFEPDVYVIRSSDDGATWEAVGQSVIGVPGTVCEFTTADTIYPYRIGCCWQRGRIVLTHQSVGTAAPSVAETIGAMYLGGWTTVTMPTTVTAPAYDTAGQITLPACWIPIDVPDASAAWTASGAGTAALGTGGTYLDITTTVNARNYTTVPAGTVAQGVFCRAEVAVITGVTTADAVVIQLRAADGVSDYRVTARIGTSSVVFIDGNGATTIGTVTIDVTAGVEILMQLQGTGFVGYVRARSSGEDCDLGTRVTTNTLVAAGAPATGNQLRWGHVNATTSHSQWYRMSWDRSTGTGLNLATMAYPADLQARHIDARPAQLTAGLAVGAVGGPGFYGMNYAAVQGYDYAAANLEIPSPRIGWRAVTPSAGTPPIEMLQYPLHPTLTVESAIGTPLLGLLVLGANVRTGSIRGQATHNPHLSHGECVGWMVEMVPAGGGASVFRRLIGNTGGTWGVSGQVQPVLYMEAADGTEPATGTLSLYPPDFAVLAQVGWNTYRALRVVFDAQDTPDGYIAAGTVMLGAVHIVGADWSYGRVVNLEANTSTIEYRDGTDRVTVNGPPARTYEVAMVDGVDMRRALGVAPDPDVYSTSLVAGSKPVGTFQSWPMDLMHLIGALDGAATPVAYLDDVQKVDVQIVNRRDRLAWVRVTSPVRLENRVGLPGRDELVNIATVTMHEVT